MHIYFGEWSNFFLLVGFISFIIEKGLLFIITGSTVAKLGQIIWSDFLNQKLFGIFFFNIESKQILHIVLFQLKFEFTVGIWVKD